MMNIFAVLKRSQLRRAGDMSHECLPNRLCYTEQKAGKCSHGGQKDVLQRCSEGLPEVLWHQP